MNTFERALAHTLKIEGTYSDDPDDPGGETFAGIARNYWPDWEGWSYIDVITARGERPVLTEHLQRLVHGFYRVNFYDRIGGDRLVFPELGIEMFEMAVNTGTSQAACFLQEALNLLNRNGKSWPEILVAATIGTTTIGTLHKAMTENHGAKSVIKMVNALQAEFYLECIRARPVSEKYIRGWLKRT